jgi:histidine ammonia-lyase
MLNDHINKMPIKVQQMEGYRRLEKLYWDCSSVFLQNKQLVYPLSGDSINGSAYIRDISFSARNAYEKYKRIWRTILWIIGLELLIGIECLEEMRKTIKEKLTPQLEQQY